MQHTDREKGNTESGTNNGAGVRLNRKTWIVIAVIVVAAIGLRMCGA